MGRLKCFVECEHNKGECKGLDDAADNSEFCNFCLKLCVKCSKQKFELIIGRFGPRQEV